MTGPAAGLTVLAQQWISVDGFASGPVDESEVFAAAPDSSDADDHTTDLLGDVSTVLLGASTYCSFSRFWPTSDHRMAGPVNAARKVVASRRMTEAPWGEHAPARVVDDAVRFVGEQREADGGVLLVWGSLQVMRALAAARELDELEVLVSPLVLGSGTPLFGADGPYRMRQLGGDVWPSGVTRLRFSLRAV